MFSFLGYNKIDKKQKFSALDIVESQRKEMWSFWCEQVSLPRWSIFLFSDVLTIKCRVIILPTDWLEIILPTACTTKNYGAFV